MDSEIFPLYFLYMRWGGCEMEATLISSLRQLKYEI